MYEKNSEFLLHKILKLLWNFLEFSNFMFMWNFTVEITMLMTHDRTLKVVRSERKTGIPLWLNERPWKGTRSTSQIDMQPQRRGSWVTEVANRGKGAPTKLLTELVGPTQGKPKMHAFKQLPHAVSSVFHLLTLKPKTNIPVFMNGLSFHSWITGL